MFKPLKHFLSVLFFILAMFDFAVRTAEALTLLYSGEEHGHLGLHGCGAEQVGGLAHRLTLLDDLRIRHGTVLKPAHRKSYRPNRCQCRMGLPDRACRSECPADRCLLSGARMRYLSHKKTLAGVRGKPPRGPCCLCKCSVLISGNPIGFFLYLPRMCLLSV